MRLQPKPWRYLIVLLSLLITITLIACGQLPAADNSVEIDSNQMNQEKAAEIVSQETGVLTIWWYEGYVEAEDSFLKKIVGDWEKENGKKIQLVFFDQDQLLKEIGKAVESGATPDITVDRTQLVTRLAWQGKLKDVSTIVKPVINSFPNSILKNSYQYNNSTKAKSYYAVPIYQEGIYLHYWQDMLEQLGYSPADIPQDWDDFWQFWLTIQQQLPQQESVFALGLPTSPYSTDTFLFFEHILEAYNVKILNSRNQLLINHPRNRQGIIKALEWWAKLYQQEYIPPSALVWENSDNNSSFYNRIVAMTPNPTLSIPASRAEEQEVYLKQLGTVGFPKKPNGQPMTYITRVRQALVFADRNFDDAVSFLSYLIRPEVLADYMEAAGGRFFPSNKANWDDPFWTNPEDPHISSVRKLLTESPTRPHYFSDNPAYMEVLEKNVWGHALYSILTEDTSPEVAADQAISQINQIFSQWQS